MRHGRTFFRNSLREYKASARLSPIHWHDRLVWIWPRNRGAPGRGAQSRSSKSVRVTVHTGRYNDCPPTSTVSAVLICRARCHWQFLVATGSSTGTGSVLYSDAVA
jgi:hypothetical protein